MKRLILILTVLLGTPMPASSQSIVGVWRRVEIETRGGPNPGTMQSEPALLMYTDQHFMWTMVQGEGPRPLLPPQGQATDAQIAAAVLRYTAQGGTYELRGDTITYHVQTAWAPNAMRPPNNTLVRQVLRITADTLETTGGRNPDTGILSISRYVRVE